MGIYESDTIIFHGATEESMEKIRAFLQGYNDLFKTHFGEDNDEGNIYVGGIPTYGFELDRESDSFPRSEGFYVAGISPRWAKGWYWENAVGFLGVFLERKLCSKITWHRYWDQGEPNCIYMNESQESVPFSWKHYEFVPGENGVPSESSEEDEDAFDRFVDEIMKGERVVEWRQDFPDYWHDRYDNLLERMERARRNDDVDFGSDDECGDDPDSEKHDSPKAAARSASKPGNAASFRSAGGSAGTADGMGGFAKRIRPQDLRSSGKDGKDDPSAGEAQPAGRVCPNCGQQWPESARFCKACGTKLAGAENPPAENAEPGVPPSPSKDFTLIGSFIHWNILPEQIAVKIDENDIAAYGREVKGVSIQDGVMALFFFNGKLTAQLGAGSYPFKDLGVDTKQKKDASADKDKKKPDKKKLFGSFVNRIVSFFPGRSRERARNAAAAGLTNRIPANIPPVSIVLVRTTDFPLVFTFPEANTANLRSEIGLQTLCRVTDIAAFYSRILSGDRKMVALKEIAETLEPSFRREIDMFFATVSPEQVNFNAELQDRLLARLQAAVPQVHPFISVVNIVSLTASNAELDGLRRLREDLYVSERTLEETMRRNVFLSRMEEARSEQDLRMRDIRNAHGLSARRKDDAQSVSLEQMDVSLAAARETIYEEMSLTEDEKAKFNMMLAAQRMLREAKSADEVEAAMQEFAKNGLLRQREMDNLRHEITHDARLRDLNDIQILSLATMRNQQELDRKKLEWEMQAEKDRLDHQIEQERKKDGFQTEHFRTELEMDRMRKEQDSDLNHQDRLKRLERLRQLQTIRQEKENAQHLRNLETEAVRAENQREITRIYKDMTPEQIMASNPNISPEAAQALAARNDKSMEFMQQLLQMKQEEIERTRADANANSDRFVDGMKTTISAFGGMMGQQPSMNRMPGTSGAPGSRPFSAECPRCHRPVEDAAVFCDNCGLRLEKR
jgi:hypothetical protein